MSSPSVETRIRVRRHPERACYDIDAVHAVLRDGWLAHVGFVGADGAAVVIPMLYALLDGGVYLHGAVASRLLVKLGGGAACCVSVTHVDGLVLARSHFSHSVNYRSAVLFGQAREVTDLAQKAEALSAFVDQMLPGRAAEARPADATELNATRLLRFEIEAASVKIRSGGVKDHAEDLQLPVWAGVVPLQQHYQTPITEAGVMAELPPSVQQLRARNC